MSDLTRSITISGGGLAGLSLAIALRRRDLPVTIFESGSYPRHRVCGEFISGVADETLENLGIANAFSECRRHRSFSWWQQGREFHQGELDQAALGISRHHLDYQLATMAQQIGCALQTGHRSKPAPFDGHIWAAGRRPCNGPWIGLKAHVKSIKKASDLEMHLGANGYLGLAEVEDGWVNACGLFRIDRSIRAKGPDLLPAYLEAGGNTRLATDIRNAIWRDDSFTAVAGFSLGRQPEIPGLLCLGDAESIIPPFTGNGMSMAFQAAEAAISPLVQWHDGKIPWATTVSDIKATLRSQFSLRLQSARLLHPFLLKKSGRTLLRALAGCRALPVRPILSLIR